MNTTGKKQILGLLFALGGGLLLSLTGCSSGDTDGGKAADETFEGSQFVDTDAAAGSIDVQVNDEELEVSRITGFNVYVKDSVGAPVENIAISCDSEEGVAIIEPTQGKETTDSGGHISGKIGCSLPGSFLFGCRLPIGANKRKFVTIRCGGTVPTGFDGFPGSAGGGIGGGVVDSEDGGPGGSNSDGIRMTVLTFADNGADTDSIDVLQTPDCDTSSSTDEDIEEPFTDSTVAITVQNNTNSNIRFNTLQVTIDNSENGSPSQYNSKAIALIGEAVTANGGSTVVGPVIVFDAQSGQKFVPGVSASLTSAIGFRNVTVRLDGTNDLGEAVTVSGRRALSFDNFDNCG